MEENKIDKVRYAEFVRGIDIIQINLVKINAEKYFFGSPNENIDVQINNKAIVKEVSNEQFRIEFETIVSSTFLGKEKMFDIDIKYELIYSCQGNFDEMEYNDFIELFSYRNVPVNIWPYTRELISETTSRMGFPPLILKPLKIF